MSRLGLLRRGDGASAAWVESTAGVLRSWADSFSEQVLAVGRSPAAWDVRAASGDLLALSSRIRRPRRGFGKLPRLKLEETFQMYLWPLAAERAWRQSAFAERFARRLLDVLRHRYAIVEPGPSGASPAPWPVPRISPWTWWLLLEVAGIPALGKLGRRPWRWRHRRLARRLRGITGSLLAAAPAEWAGFWDQWLLGEVLLRVKSDEEMPYHWNPMLDAMPWLHQLFANRGAPEPPEDQGSPSRRDWQRHQPPWILIHPDEEKDALHV